MLHRTELNKNEKMTKISTIKVCRASILVYKLRYIVGLGLVEMVISTNPKPTIYGNLYENTGPDIGTWIQNATRNPYLRHTLFSCESMPS